MCLTSTRRSISTFNSITRKRDGLCSIFYGSAAIEGINAVSSLSSGGGEKDSSRGEFSVVLGTCVLVYSAKGAEILGKELAGGTGKVKILGECDVIVVCAEVKVIC